RLLNHMDARGYRRIMPLEPPSSVAREPLLNLNSGYIRRSLELMPTQGSRLPWRLHQNYLLDVRMLRRGQLEDEGVEFSGAARPIGAARISSGMPKASTSAAA
ncbi:MAG TPA: FAD-containing monooxygenase EthA, partial [Chloroflexota bacterium]